MSVRLIGKTLRRAPDRIVYPTPYDPMYECHKQGKEDKERQTKIDDAFANWVPFSKRNPLLFTRQPQPGKLFKFLQSIFN